MQEKVPLLRVPDAGVFEPQDCVCALSGAVTWQEAMLTPDFASVRVMLQVTFCDPDETSTLVGERLAEVRAGGVVSGSEVRVSVDGKPKAAGLMFALLPTASLAVTLAVKTPDGE